jgi:hypothetical protein
MLSLNKLEKILTTQGFLIKSIYSYDKYCVYIEILCLTNADIFLLYIPSKYDILINEKYQIYNIKYIELKDIYTNLYENEDDNIEKTYEDIKMEDNDNIIEQLDNIYKKQIILDNKDKVYNNIKNIYKQLNRLKYSVQTIKYKISIQYKNFLCNITRDNEINCCIIENISVYDNQIRNIYITIDLETFFSKVNNVIENIINVRNNIYKILNRTQSLKYNNMFTGLDKLNELICFNKHIEKKKETNTSYILSLENMYKQLCNTEKKIYNKLDELNNITDEQYNKDEIIRIENKINDINKIKEKIFKYILTLKNKQSDLYLFVDKMIYDNSVMLNEIVNNIDKVKEYIDDYI